MTKGYLVLETGETFIGDYIGAEVETEGEIVFNTSMTGYQEMLSDPSYSGQLLTLTYPAVGNYGINSLDNESKGISVSAVIMNDICDEPSHYQSTSTLSEQLKKANVPGLVNVDTRSLTSSIRKYQTVKGRISKTSEVKTEWENQNTIDLVKKVSLKKKETYGDGNHHVVLMDFGFKNSILQALLKKDCKVTVVPFDTSYGEIESLHPDGILLSNGPGNPTELHEVLETVKVLTEKYPTFGISLGHQLIALAYGAEVEKLAQGHRGSYPVKNLQTKKVYMTAQNHGFTVIDESINKQAFEVTFKNVNDQSIEGMKHVRLPVQSVQFHPEAHPGPSDTEAIFNEFIQLVKTWGGKKYAEAVK